MSHAQAISSVWIRPPGAAFNANKTATDILDANTKWAPTATRLFDPRTAKSNMIGSFSKTNTAAFGIVIDVTTGGATGWTTPGGLDTNFTLPMSTEAVTGLWYWEIDVAAKTFRLISPVAYQGYRTVSVSPATLTAANNEVTVDTSGGAFTLNVPATNPGAGWACLVKKITTDTNAITIARGAFGGNIQGAAANWTWADSTLTNYPGLYIVSDGVDYWIQEGSAGYGAGGATLIYQPGGVQAGSIFTSWSDLIDAWNALGYDALGGRVVFDDSLDIIELPSGTWQVGVPMIWAGWHAGTTTTVTLLDGFEMPDCSIGGEFAVKEFTDSIYVEGQADSGGSNKVPFTNDAVDNILLTRGAMITSSVDLPLIKVHASKKLTLRMFASAVLLLNDNNVVGCFNGGTVDLRADQWSVVQQNTFGGTGMTLNAEIADSSEIQASASDQPNVGGNVNLTYHAKAQFHDYTPTTSGDWPSPNPATTGAALDLLAPGVGALVGDDNLTTGMKFATVDTSGGNCTVTVPTSPYKGWCCTVQKITTDTNTIDIGIGGFGGNLQGAAGNWTWTLSAATSYPWIEIWCDGTDLWIK